MKLFLIVMISMMNLYSVVLVKQEISNTRPQAEMIVETNDTQIAYVSETNGYTLNGVSIDEVFKWFPTSELKLNQLNALSGKGNQKQYQGYIAADFEQHARMVLGEYAEECFTTLTTYQVESSVKGLEDEDVTVVYHFLVYMKAVEVEEQVNCEYLYIHPVPVLLSADHKAYRFASGTGDTPKVTVMNQGKSFIVEDYIQLEYPKDSSGETYFERTEPEFISETVTLPFVIK